MFLPSSSSSSSSNSCHRGRASCRHVPHNRIPPHSISHLQGRVYGGAVARPLWNVPAAAPTGGDSSSSVDSVLESLREAFGAAPAASTQQQRLQNLAQQPAAGAKGGFAAAGVRASRNKGGSRDAAAGKAAAGRQPAAAAAAAATIEDAAGAMQPPKKRRGRFSELILSLEHQQLYPEAASSSSSDTSTSGGNSDSSSSSEATMSSSSSESSSTGNTAASNDSSYSPAAAATSSTTSSTSSTSSSSIRRIRRGRTNPVDDSQQQQQPQQFSSNPRTPQQQQRQQPQPHQHDTQRQQQQDLPPWLLQQRAAEAAAAAQPGSRRVKVYAPVSKGDLLLPGGPSWSGLRRHLVAAGDTAGLPELDCIVIVEGDRDQQAVGRAVNAPVYVCDGTRALKDHVRPELTMLQQLGCQLVVLTDPDERGRELRMHLDDIMGPLHHAFVPEQQGTSDRDGPVHAAGNRGIEHVVPLGVQQALADAKPSWPKGRSVWSLEDLQRLQLANAFDAGHDGVVRGPGGAADRRRQLCALLGLGRCTAAQLLTVLNRFFSEEDVEAALAKLDAQVQGSSPGETMQ